MNLKDRLEKAELSTNTNPTELQKEKGNYKKGKVTIEGLSITIENPSGSIRSGKDNDGKEWEVEMPYTYGYFNRTLGKDGDQVDVYIGDHFDDFEVYIIDQIEEKSKAFDEHKVMFGFKNEEEAKASYLSCFEEGWEGFGNITTISLNKFKIWLNDSSMKKYPASKLNTISKMDIKNIDLGDRISLVRLFGEVESEKTLKKMQKDAGDIDNFDKLIVEIASPGGSVSEGLEIMMWLDSLSQQGKEIITVVVANAYSIASLIMLSANIKLISKHGKVMVHNPMVPELKYVNANDLETHIAELRELESSMYDLYQMFTGLEKEDIKKLMDEETYLLPQEAVDYGFADMVVDIKPKSFEMTTNRLKETNMLKTMNLLNAVIARVNGSEHVNQVYTDDAGEEIEIFQGDASTYKKGDRTSLENGMVTLSDGAKVTVENFIITDIDRSVDPNKEGEEVDASFNEGNEPKAEEGDEVKAIPEVVPEVTTDPAKVIEKTESTITTKEVQNTTVKQVSKWESEVVNDTFEVGAKIEYSPYEEGGEPYSVGVGQWELEDGSSVLTDAEGIVRLVIPANGEVMPEAKAEEEEMKAKEDAEMKTKEDAEAKVGEDEIKAKLDKLENKNKELEAKVTEMENKYNEGSKSVEAKLEKVNKFEETAAQAIDTIASSMQSNFSPEAKASSGIQAKGSIFQQLKKQRGL